MNDFFDFLRHPEYLKSKKINWRDFFNLYFISILADFLLVPIIVLSIGLLKLEQIDFNLSKIVVITILLILAPLFEEILFRLILKPTWLNIWILIITMLFLTILSAFRSFSITGILLACFIVLLLPSGFSKKFLRSTQMLIVRHFNIAFYISCIFFGFLHLFNYKPVSPGLFLLFPIIVSPQLISGCFLGYIRNKYGIIYSMLFHAMGNSVVGLIYLLK